MSDEETASSNHAIQPAPEHEWLHHQVGDWNVKCSYFMGSPDSPIEVDGKETVVALGDFWVVATFEADMLGTPMCGHASTGYDPVKKKFVGTWKDTSTPFLYTFEGLLEDTGDAKTLRMSGENFDPVRECPATYVSHIKYFSDDERVLNLGVEGDGGVYPILEYYYTRNS